MKNFSKKPHAPFFSSGPPAGAWGQSSGSDCIRVLFPDIIILLADSLKLGRSYSSFFPFLPFLVAPERKTREKFII